MIINYSSNRVITLLSAIEKENTELGKISFCGFSVAEGEDEYLSLSCNPNFSFSRATLEKIAGINEDLLMYFDLLSRARNNDCDLTEIKLFGPDNYYQVLGVKSALKNNTEVSCLKFPACDFELGEGIVTASILREKTTITRLVMTGMDVGGLSLGAVIVIADVLKENKTLTELTISAGGIDDDGVQSLMRSLQGNNNTLQKLNLSSNCIGNIAVQSIVQFLLRGNTSLIELNLDCLSISIRSVIALLTALDMTRVNADFSLILSNKLLTEQLISEIERQNLKLSEKTLRNAGLDRVFPGKQFDALLNRIGKAAGEAEGRVNQAALAGGSPRFLSQRQQLEVASREEPAAGEGLSHSSSVQRP